MYMTLQRLALSVHSDRMKGYLRGCQIKIFFSRPVLRTFSGGFHKLNSLAFDENCSKWWLVLVKFYCV
jgi:hypothetical protein